MALEVSQEVAGLFFVLTGERFPDANEDQLRALATVWRESAAQLMELYHGLKTAVVHVRNTFDGGAERAFADRMAKWVDGAGIGTVPGGQVPSTAGGARGRGSGGATGGEISAGPGGDGMLASVAYLFVSLADFLDKLAEDVEYTKLVIIYQLTLLLAEIALAYVLSPFTGGLVWEYLAAKISVVKVLMKHLLGQLLLQFATAWVIGSAFQILVDVLAQSTQFGMGTRDDWNEEHTRTAAEVGALGAAVSLILAPLHGPISNGVNSVLSSMFRTKFDDFGKNFAIILGGGLHESTTDLTYTGMKEGKLSDTFYGAFTAGMASGAANVLGEFLGKVAPYTDFDFETWGATRTGALPGTSEEKTPILSDVDTPDFDDHVDDVPPPSNDPSYSDGPLFGDRSSDGPVFSEGPSEDSYSDGSTPRDPFLEDTFLGDPDSRGPFVGGSFQNGTSPDGPTPPVRVSVPDGSTLVDSPAPPLNYPVLSPDVPANGPSPDAPAPNDQPNRSAPENAPVGAQAGPFDDGPIASEEWWGNTTTPAGEVWPADTAPPRSDGPEFWERPGETGMTTTGGNGISQPEMAPDRPHTAGEQPILTGTEQPVHTAGEQPFVPEMPRSGPGDAPAQQPVPSDVDGQPAAAHGGLDGRGAPLDNTASTDGRPRLTIDTSTANSVPYPMSGSPVSPLTGVGAAAAPTGPVSPISPAPQPSPAPQAPQPPPAPPLPPRTAAAQSPPVGSTTQPVTAPAPRGLLREDAQREVADRVEDQRTAEDPPDRNVAYPPVTGHTRDLPNPPQVPPAASAAPYDVGYPHASHAHAELYDVGPARSRGPFAGRALDPDDTGGAHEPSRSRAPAGSLDVHQALAAPAGSVLTRQSFRSPADEASYFTSRYGNLRGVDQAPDTDNCLEVTVQSSFSIMEGDTFVAGPGKPVRIGDVNDLAGSRFRAASFPDIAEHMSTQRSGAQGLVFLGGNGARGHYILVHKDDRGVVNFVNAKNQGMGAPDPDRPVTGFLPLPWTGATEMSTGPALHPGLTGGTGRPDAPAGHHPAPATNPAPRGELQRIQDLLQSGQVDLGELFTLLHRANQLPVGGPHMPARIADVLSAAVNDRRLSQREFEQALLITGAMDVFSGNPQAMPHVASTAVPPGQDPAHLRQVRDVAGALHQAIAGRRFDEAVVILRDLGRDQQTIWAVQDAYRAHSGHELRDKLLGLRHNEQKFIDHLLGWSADVPVQREQAEYLFNHLGNVQFDHHQHGRMYVPVRFADDGCYLRAHLWALELNRLGASPAKVFVARTNPDLLVLTPNAPDAFLGPAPVAWAYHVAPVVEVYGADGRPRPMVFDPVSADRPLTVDEWLRQMGADDGVSVTGDLPEVQATLAQDQQANPQGWTTLADGRWMPSGRAVVVTTEVRAYGFPGPGSQQPTTWQVTDSLVRQRVDELAQHFLTEVQRAQERADFDLGVLVDVANQDAAQGRHQPERMMDSLRLLANREPVGVVGAMQRNPDEAVSLRGLLPDHTAELRELFPPPVPDSVEMGGASDRSNYHELVESLRADQRAVSGNDLEFNGIGIDLFGLHEAMEPPDFLAGRDYSNLPADRIVSLFRALDMASRDGRPTREQTAPESLPVVSGSVLRFAPAEENRSRWAPNTAGQLLPELLEMPRVLHRIWLGGPLTDRADGHAKHRKGISEAAQRFKGELDTVLWTDVPREVFEAVDHREPLPEDDPLAPVQEMLTWARQNDIRLINVDELSNADHPLPGHDLAAVERAKQTPEGSAGASDVLRVAILHTYGGLYLDGDNTLKSLEYVDTVISSRQGYALEVDNLKHEYGNSALAAPRGHPFLRRYLANSRARYGEDYDGLMETTEVEGRGNPDTQHERLRRKSIWSRVGPGSLDSLAKSLGYEVGNNDGLHLPGLGGLSTESFQTWLAPAPATHEIRTNDKRATREFTKRVVQTLARGLSNRALTLPLTAVDAVVRRHEDRDLIWNAAITYLVEHPVLGGLITGALVGWRGADGRRSYVELPQHARDVLGLNYDQFSYDHGEIKVDTNIKNPGNRLPDGVSMGGGAHGPVVPFGRGKDLTFADVDFVALPQEKDGEEVGVAFPLSDREAAILRSGYEHGADSAVRKLFGAADGKRRFSVVVHFRDGWFTVRDGSGVVHQLGADQMVKLLLSAGRPGPAWDQRMSLLWLSCELGSLPNSITSGALRNLLREQVGEQRAPRGRPELFETGGVRLNGDPVITVLGEPESPRHETARPGAGVYEGDSVVMASDTGQEPVSGDGNNDDGNNDDSQNIALYQAAGDGRSAQADVIAPGAPARDDETGSGEAHESHPSSAPSGTGGHGVGGWVFNVGAAEREQALSVKYGTQVGPAPGDGAPHFSHSFLDKIDKVWAGLPSGHVRGNDSLRAIIRNTSPGAASRYDPDTEMIDISHPYRMPSWLFTWLSKGIGWQRWLMDQGAMRGYAGIDRGNDRALEIDHGAREVMAGVSDVLAQGNLVEWILRHELAHSVDKNTGWREAFAAEERFGGWLEYEGKEGRQRVAAAIFGKVGITAQEAGTTLGDGTTSLLDSVSFAMGKVARQKPEVLTRLPERFDEGSPLRAKVEAAVRFIRTALAQPWTLPDGGGDAVTVGNRIYQLSPYGQWVSYRHAARQYAVSNYQFSDPGEWFAEAYAAFHDPTRRPRAQLRPDVQDWFAAQARHAGGMPTPQTVPEGS